MVTGARAGLSTADRWWIRLLGALLPPGFRDRQRGEWAADLQSLAHDRAARTGYLLGAARSLPALRAAARGHDSVVLAMSERPSALTAWRVLTIMLTWSVVGWLCVAYQFEASGHGEVVNTELSGLELWLSIPVGLFSLGGMGAVFGPALGFVTALVTVVHAVAERHRDSGHRVGVAATALGILLLVCAQPTLNQLIFSADGDTLAVLALATLPFMTRRTGLSVGRRVVLGVLALAAVAVVISYQTPWGHDLGVWLRD
ncbi:hypothetical protein [Catenuloplanes japonicus]|uniref:hypothetical protein n=1 Tax=Catenuloplanes japonicus TaxID=33876 RepID=UPI000526D870|nr:hypothetical protein [Catenuloplanes japonicus]